MNVVLINPTPADHYSPCIRTLTAYLKMHGHTVRQIFLPADTYSHLHVREGYIMQLEQSMVEDLVELCKDADLVGISFLTTMFDVTVQATRALQMAYPDLPIMWGGFHPTTMPQQALDFVLSMVDFGGQLGAPALLRHLHRDGARARGRQVEGHAVAGGDGLGPAVAGDGAEGHVSPSARRRARSGRRSCRATSPAAWWRS